MRFRTAVPATRDVAFVLAAVVVGMAIGAGQYWVTALGLLIVGLATHFNGPASGSTAPSDTLSPSTTSVAEQSWRLTIQTGLAAATNFETELTRMTQDYRLISAETVRRGGGMEYVYQMRLKPEHPPAELVAALHVIPLVESVAVKGI